jgi:hypothetical protein
MNLLVPLSLTVSGGVTQLAVLRLAFCCGLQPVEGEGHLTSAFMFLFLRSRCSNINYPVRRLE